VEKAMKNTVLTFALTIAMLSIPVVSSAEEAIASLRGTQSLTELSGDPAKRKLMVVEGGIERSFTEQPPMVPHEVDKYEVTLKNNGCMKCHSEKTYEKENAPKIGDSHYIDRDGNKLDTLSSRRYFCGQCHAPQLKGEPLVENQFQGRK
jgi:cytochrome c-type protein NapB